MSVVGLSKRTTISVLFVMACLLATAYLLLVSNGQAGPRPESPPGAHKARIVRHAYWYRTVWVAKDGSRIYASCRVRRVTLCWVTRIG